MAFPAVGELLLAPTGAPDLMIVQLSTNDAATGKPFGAISGSMNIADFDDRTIAGAIETIIAYARETFRCPVAFYTGTAFDSPRYAEMVRLLKDIQRKWHIGVIDLFDDPEMTAVCGTPQYHRYMHDPVHPFRRGYVEWWTPAIEAGIRRCMKRN